METESIENLDNPHINNDVNNIEPQVENNKDVLVNEPLLEKNNSKESALIENSVNLNNESLIQENNECPPPPSPPIKDDCVEQQTENQQEEQVATSEPNQVEQEVQQQSNEPQEQNEPQENIVTEQTELVPEQSKQASQITEEMNEVNNQENIQESEQIQVQQAQEQEKSLVNNEQEAMEQEEQQEQQEEEEKEQLDQSANMQQELNQSANIQQQDDRINNDQVENENQNNDEQQGQQENDQQYNENVQQNDQNNVQQNDENNEQQNQEERDEQQLIMMENDQKIEEGEEEQQEEMQQEPQSHQAQQDSQIQQEDDEEQKENNQENFNNMQQQQHDNSDQDIQSEQRLNQQQQYTQQNAQQPQNRSQQPTENEQEAQQQQENQKDNDIKEESILSGILNSCNKSRYARISPESAPSIGCHFLGGKSLQLTNINDASRLYMYFFGTKILRQLLKKANQTLHEIYKRTNDIRDYTIDEIQVYQALKIVMGLQQNSSNFEFFLLKDLQKIPPYCQLFTNERFQFLIDCEKELNKDILNNEQLMHDFVSRAQNSQTSDQELVLLSKMKSGAIIHNEIAYSQIYLCELSTSFIFGYYVVKDVNQFANQAMINLENFTNLNHHIYLSSDEFLCNISKIPEFLKHKLFMSTYLNTTSNELEKDIKELLPEKSVKENSSEIIFDKETKTQYLVNFDENKKKEIFATTSGTVKQEKMVQKHKQAIQKITEKLHKQLIEYRFVNIRGESSIFEELSEIAIQNSFIIYVQAKEKIDYRQFRLKLAMELLQKQIQKLKSEESVENKQKLVDVEVQTEKVVGDNELLHNPTKIFNIITPNTNEITNPLNSSPQMKGLHLKQKFDKQGMCRMCLQQNNVSNYTNVICTECTAQNKHQIFFCDKCFDVHYDQSQQQQQIQSQQQQQQQQNPAQDNFTKEQFSRLATLKTSLPMDKMQGKGLLPPANTAFQNGTLPATVPPTQLNQLNNGYGFQPQHQQAPVRRRRANVQDGYETSGPTFNSMAPQQPLQMPLKRRGIPLDDAGFRSDAPGSYLPAPRGRKRMSALNDGFQQPRNDFGYNDMMVQQGNTNMNAFGQQNVNGYDRFPRTIDMNGYNTSDPNYGRYNNGYPNQQAFRPNQVQRK